MSSRIFLIYKIYLMVVVLFDVLIILPGAMDTDPAELGPLGRWIDYAGYDEHGQYRQFVTTLWCWKFEDFFAHDVDGKAGEQHLFLLLGIFGSMLLSMVNLAVVQMKRRRRAPLAVAVANLVLGIALFVLHFGWLLPAVDQAVGPNQYVVLSYTTMGPGFYLFFITLVLNLLLVVFSVALLYKRKEFKKVWGLGTT